MSRLALVVLLSGIAACSGGATQDDGTTALPPLGKTRVVDFETDEGTWMSLDVSPDGAWIVFDLLGQIYRTASAGGEAECLTQASGIALNFHPAYSPDGGSIAFVSDRRGQNNVWLMDGDGGHPRPLFVDSATRFTDPTFTPDGQAVVAVRAFPTPGRGWHRQTTSLWLLPLDGAEPRELLSAHLTHYRAPSFAPDGRLYFHVGYSTGDGLGLLQAGHRLQRLDLATGRIENVRGEGAAAPSAEMRAALDATTYASDVEGEAAAALDPEVSPDGRQLAFALERDGTFSYRGHELEPRTALMLRDLETGEERTLLDPAPKDLTRVNAQYAYRVFPGFAWSPDGDAIIIAHEGKLVRVGLDGSTATIPFRARVRREISEQVRGRVEIEDASFVSKFLQWPASSPDKSRLAFVAVGRIWLVDLEDGAPRPGAAPHPLTAPMAPSFQLTPAWSPDGTRIAFATWHDRERGHLWLVSPDGGEPQRLTTEPAEVIHPTWSPDGSFLVATVGPGPADQPLPARSNGWSSVGGWRLVRFPLDGGRPRTLATLGTVRRPAFGPGGRVYFPWQEDVRAASDLYRPFPSAEVRRRSTVWLRSVAATGGDERLHLRFPPARERGSEPLISPDGRFVAHLSSRNAWVTELERIPEPSGGEGDEVPAVVTDPDQPMPGRRRVSELGGLYPRWRDATRLELVSGNRYIVYDAETGEVTTHRIELRLPRDRARGTIALTGAKLVTLGPEGVLPSGDVVVRDGRIECVGDCELPAGTEIVDVSGKTIIPGLVDVHAHHTGEASGVVPQHRPASALALAYGVTTIVDPAADSESAFPLAELIEAGAVVGPRTWSSAETVLTTSTGFGDYLAVSSPEAAAQHVDRRADWGAITIKNYRQPARAQHRLLITAARERGISITSEGGPLYFDVGLAMDGQTGWEHFLAPLPLYADATTFFGLAGITYSPTVIVAGHVDGAKEYFRPRQKLLEDEKYRRFMPLAELEAQVAASAEPTELWEVSFPIVAEGLADIVRAGGYGALGEHGEQFGIGTHWELWAYATALTPLEALTVASLHGARYVGLEEEIGSLEPGKLADLVVLEHDPLEDITATAHIAWVMKAGHLYDDDTLEEVWPRARAWGPAAWQ